MNCKEFNKLNDRLNELRVPSEFFDSTNNTEILMGGGILAVLDFEGDWIAVQWVGDIITDFYPAAKSKNK